MFEVFFKDKLAPLALRLALGLVFASHGYVKIMANGGTAWTSELSTPWQLLIAWGEFAAGLAILVGFRCRTATAAALLLTTGTLLWRQGWRVFDLPLATLEPTFLLLIMGLALIFLGAGEISVDGRGSGRSTATGRAARRAG